MTEGMFSKKIGDICQKYLNKRATVDIFRHSFISEFKSTNPTVEERKKISKFMCHSLESQLYYDKSKHEYIEKDIHTVLPKSDDSFTEEEVEEIKPLEVITLKENMKLDPSKELKPISIKIGND